MAHINNALFEKIGAKLGIGPRQTYQRIAAKASELMVSRDLAAIALAADLGINVAKGTYATDQQRAELRSASAGRPPRPSQRAGQPAEGPALPPPTRRGRGARRVPARKSNSVMVVHGRNMKARNALYTFLRTIGLQPIEFSQAVRATRRGAPYVGQVLDTMFRQAAAVVVLLTPDDEARLRKKYQKASDSAYEGRLTGQARANVLFEAGRAFGSHPDSTILVQIGTVRPFTDTAGVHVVHLTNGPEPRRDLANRLEAAGCAINISGTDWLSAGDFSDA